MAVDSQGDMMKPIEAEGTDMASVSLRAVLADAEAVVARPLPMFCEMNFVAATGTASWVITVNTPMTRLKRGISPASVCVSIRATAA